MVNDLKCSCGNPSCNFSPSYHRGNFDCQLDDWENAPFSSTGGLDNRNNLTTPKWIAEQDRTQYLEGYQAAALELYGLGWRTTKFSWNHAITINKKD